MATDLSALAETRRIGRIASASSRAKFARERLADLRANDAGRARIADAQREANDAEAELRQAMTSK